MYESDIGIRVVEVAAQIHQDLGSGLMLEVYAASLAHDLETRGLEVRRKVVFPLKPGNILFKQSFRADLIVENCVMLEFNDDKSISSFHKNQLLAYLQLAELRLGYLLNFNHFSMQQGIYRAAIRIPKNQNRLPRSSATANAPLAEPGMALPTRDPSAR